MSLEKKLSIAELKIECYEEYIQQCITLKVVPSRIIFMIKNAKNVEDIEEVKEILKQASLDLNK